MTAPSLNELRADARLVADAPKRKVGVYPNASGQVIVVSEDNGRRSYVEVTPEEVALFCALLIRAASEAAELGNYIESQYQTYQAIEQARER